MHTGVPTVAQWVKNPTSVHKDAGLIPSLTRWAKDLALLWLWSRPAATALIQPLAWEFPYAMGAAPKRPKKQQTDRMDIRPNLACTFFFFK